MKETHEIELLIQSTDMIWIIIITVIHIISENPISVARLENEKCFKPILGALSFADKLENHYLGSTLCHFPPNISAETREDHTCVRLLRLELQDTERKKNVKSPFSFLSDLICSLGETIGDVYKNLALFSLSLSLSPFSLFYFFNKDLYTFLSEPRALFRVARLKRWNALNYTQGLDVSDGLHATFNPHQLYVPSTIPIKTWLPWTAG